MIWVGDHSAKCLLGHTGGCLRGEVPPQKLENVVYLKLESCNFNTVGRKFRAGNEEKQNKTKQNKTFGRTTGPNFAF